MRRFPVPTLRAARGAAAVVLALGVAGCSPDSVMPEGAPTPPAASDWTLVSPRPFDADILDLWGPSRDRMFAVGRYGALLVREGETWRPAPSPTTTTIYDIDGCDWDHVYALAEDGLYFFDGTRWRAVDIPDLEGEARVCAVAPDDAMVVDEDGFSWHWNGATWSEHWVGIDPRPGEDWLAGAADGTYLALGYGDVAVWGGDAWNVRAVGYPRAEALAHVPWHPSRWCGAGRRGSDIWFGFLEGNGWDAAAVRQGNEFLDLAVGAGLHLAWRDRDGRFFITHSAGDETTLPAGLRRTTLAAFPSAGQGHDWVVAAGSFGVLLEIETRTGVVTPLADATGVLPGRFHVWPNGDFAAPAVDGGLLLGRSGSVIFVPLPEMGGVEAVAGPSSSTVYAVGYRGDLCLVADGQPRLLAAAVDTFAIRDLVCAGGQVWATGYNDPLLWNGQGWDVIPPPDPEHHVADLVVGDAGEVWASCYGRVYRRDGEGWVADGPPGAEGVFGLASDPATGDILVLSSSPAAVWRRRGGTWVDLGRPAGAPSRIAAGPDGDVWLVGFYAFHVLHDGDWRRIDGPVADWARVRRNDAGFDPTGGVYVASETGGIYHLDTGGLGPWR